MTIDDQINDEKLKYDINHDNWWSDWWWKITIWY